MNDSVLNEYTALVAAIVGPRCVRGKRSVFLAPKPVTMEQCHVTWSTVEHTYGGAPNIWHGYCVSHKADGERTLMYITRDGAAYLISNVLDVRDTGLRATDRRAWGSIVDGELAGNVFAAFDTYAVGGVSVMNLPLLRPATTSVWGAVKDRDSATRLVCDQESWERTGDEQCIQLHVKQHVAADGEDMRSACRSLLADDELLPYKVDGLIFTPRDLSVFGYYPGRHVGVTGTSMKWDSVIKWKPPSLNTIDFLVREEAGQTSCGGGERAYSLMTGYNESQWRHLTPLEGLRLRYDRTYMAERRTTAEAYVPRQFASVRLATPAVCADGSAIVDGCIAEFSYDPCEQKWAALRVRQDKTSVFRMNGGRISGAANDLSVATSIWRSIHAPVTEGMLTGDEPAPCATDPSSTLEQRMLSAGDTYYARQVPRQHMLSVHMLNVHNHGIKRMLYERAPRRGSLLEIACGMAGDLPRWVDAGYGFVLGVDIVRANVTNPRDGAYARLLRHSETMRRSGGRHLDAAFAVADCSLPLNGDCVEDAESRRVLDIVFGRQRGDAHHRFVAGRAARGFDVVACMFAVHYFMKNEATLDGFLKNASANLRPGGLLIATFMDAGEVQAALDATGTGAAEGRKLGVPVWAIVGRGGNAGVSGYGQVIDVYLENTGRFIPEYLVHMGLLCERAELHGLVLEESRLFSETLDDLRAGTGQGCARIRRDLEALDADPVQKRFSSLNRWAVFRRLG